MDLVVDSFVVDNLTFGSLMFDSLVDHKKMLAVQLVQIVAQMNLYLVVHTLELEIHRLEMEFRIVVLEQLVQMTAEVQLVHRVEVMMEIQCGIVIVSEGDF